MKLAWFAPDSDPIARREPDVALHDTAQVSAFFDEMSEGFGTHRFSYVDARVQGVGRADVDEFETARANARR